jgi:hypothetical protein
LNLTHQRIQVLIGFDQDVSTGGIMTMSIVPGHASPAPLPINTSEFFRATGTMGTPASTAM